MFDFLFVFAYLLSTLPEVRQFGLGGTMAFIDLDTEANLPTNYVILKLYFGALACLLMVFWHQEKAPLFWKIAGLVLFIMGLDESARLHESWSFSVAERLFGTQYLSGSQFTVLPYAFLLGAFYLGSLTLFPRCSRAVFACFLLSGISLILSQACEWSLGPARQFVLACLDAISPALPRLEQSTLVVAWEEGLEMTGYSLLCGGVLIGIHAVQAMALAEVSPR